MTQVPTTSRSIPLPGVLAVAAVVLALGLLFTAPRTAADLGSAPPPATAREHPRTSTDGLAGESISPAFCRHASLPPREEALRQSHAAPRGVDSRPNEPGVLLVPKGGMCGNQLPAWLGLFRGRLPAAARPSLHVLFCTWLA
jgi:hypothetical protein